MAWGDPLWCIQMGNVRRVAAKPLPWGETVKKGPPPPSPSLNLLTGPGLCPRKHGARNLKAKLNLKTDNQLWGEEKGLEA